MFKKHLLDHVVHNLAELNDFIDNADEGLMTQVKENDYQGLIRVMEFLQSVKERQSTTDAMFEPLEEIIEVLRNYGVAIPEESLVQLQELPEKWGNTKRLSVIAIQQVAPLQVRFLSLFQVTISLKVMNSGPGSRETEEEDRRVRHLSGRLQADV